MLLIVLQVQVPWEVQIGCHTVTQPFWICFAIAHLEEQFWDLIKLLRISGSSRKILSQSNKHWETFRLVLLSLSPSISFRNLFQARFQLEESIRIVKPFWAAGLVPDLIANGRLHIFKMMRTCASRLHVRNCKPWREICSKLSCNRFVEDRLWLLCMSSFCFLLDVLLRCVVSFFSKCLFFLANLTSPCT